MQYRPVQRIRQTYVEGCVTEGTPTINRIHNTWHQLVTDYTQREITVEKDKFVAISGLACGSSPYRAECQLRANTELLQRGVNREDAIAECEKALSRRADQPPVAATSAVAR